MRKAIIVSAACALMLLGFAPAAGAGPVPRPFKGTVSGVALFVPDASCPAVGLRTDTSAVGHATLVGAVSMTSVHCSDFTFAGSMTFAAANGDEVTFSYEGGGPAPVPGTEGSIYELSIDLWVDHGHGRFEGAVGEAEMTGYMTFEGYGDFDWPVTLVWTGGLTY